MPRRGPNSLPRTERLRSPRDFQRVFARRCSARDEWLVVSAETNMLPYNRLGLSVGRKWGKAHQRNRIRRLYREAFRLTKAALPTGLDLILVPRKTQGVSLQALLASLPPLIRNLHDRLTRDRQR
jgi:ribonuclease P protein component